MDIELDRLDHFVGNPLKVRNCLTGEAIFTDRKYGVPAIKLLNAVTTATSFYQGIVDNLCRWVGVQRFLCRAIGRALRSAK